MVASTLVQIDAALSRQNGGTPGYLGVVNRCFAGGGSAKVVRITLDGAGGSDTVYLNDEGDEFDIPLDVIGSYEIASDDDSYPIFILMLDSQLPISLTAAPVVGNTSANPVPVTVV
jgi:hypothetical protein